MNFIASVILAPENLVQLEWYYCMKCRNTLFRANRDILVVSMGTMYPPTEIPRGMGWLQIRCHQCKTDWNFYWQ